VVELPTCVLPCTNVIIVQKIVVEAILLKFVLGVVKKVLSESLSICTLSLANIELVGTVSDEAVVKVAPVLC